MRSKQGYTERLNETILRVNRNFGCHLSISLTDRCPLKCTHCIVSSLPSNDFTLDLSIASAKKIASELGDLSKDIRQISFTGGEPFLVIPQMKLIIDAANQFSIKTGAVTSAYWANSEHSATKTLLKVVGIDSLTLSYDTYHSEFVTLDNIRNAITASNSMGIKTSIRYCIVPNPDQKVVEELELLRAEFGRIVHTQEVINFGRAEKEIDLLQERSNTVPVLPCLSSGPHIGRDGNVVPCCSALDPHISSSHPLALGNQNMQSLKDIFDNAKRNYLLSHIRLWGFEYLVQLLRDHGVFTETNFVSEGQCSLCAQIMHNPKCLEVIEKHVSTIDFKVGTAVGAHHYLNDSTLIHDISSNLKN